MKDIIEKVVIFACVALCVIGCFALIALGIYFAINGDLETAAYMLLAGIGVPAFLLFLLYLIIINS